MTFHNLEAESIAAFHASREIGPVWDGSELRDLLLTAPTTKASFARKLIERLAKAAGVGVQSVPGRVGSRRRIGRCVCEMKFSTEDPARFQQVRPPSDGYEYLIGIGAHPKDFVYWLLPHADVQGLIDDGDIYYQHADTSLWFRPETVEIDRFSSYRMDAGELIDAFRAFS